MIGRVLGGRYEILEEIGKGGMAYVYKARCVLLNRIVAVKILRNDLDGDDEFLNRFNAEAQAAASLSQQNIVSIFDVGEDEDIHYIVMEHIDGKTLKEYIAEKGRLNYKQALSVAMQISDALTAAHSKNIVHRDIKPHNILITKDGKIKVTDFGIARFGTGKTLSTGNDILGSVHYISPEQAKGHQVDGRSDIYSLGVVLYEMLSGKLPFEAENPVSIAMMQIEAVPQEFAHTLGDVPVSAQHIVLKAMSKDADLRYQNAESMKSDIEKVLRDPNVIIDERYLNDNFTSDIAMGKKKIVKKEENAKKSVKIAMIICALISSVIIVASSYMLINPESKDVILSVFTSSDNVEVPSLKGEELEKAKTICQNLGIKLVVEDEVEDDSYELPTVISQTPQNGEMKKGETIKLVVSKAAKLFELENYTGKNYEDIEAKLIKAGLEVNVIFEESHRDKGDIIRQSPEGGKKLKEGSEVTLYVCAGVDMTNSFISVPTLLGKTYGEAKTLLESVGLKLGSVTGSLNPESTDKVISQTIPAGSMVKKDCLVSVGVEPKQLPQDTQTQDDDTIAQTQQVSNHPQNSGDNSR